MTSPEQQPSERRLRICSVSMSMPTTKRPRNGIFVQRRLSEMAKISELQAIMPSPYFPILSPKETADTNIEFKVQSRSMPYIPVVLKSLDRHWLKRSINRVIEQQHRKSPLDAIDAHFGYPTGAACVEVGRRLKIPVFITIRGVEQRQVKQPKIAPQLLEGLRRACGVIAVSHSLKKNMVDAGISPDHIEVIPNAIDTTVFAPANRQQARQELGLDLSMPTIVAVGSLISRKGYHDLVPAFSKVLKSIPEARLVIVGGPTRYERSYPKKLTQQIEALNLQDSIQLTGPVAPSEVPKYLQAADVFALPTYQEGCCNGVLEALACGLPAVVTEAGDNAKYVTPNENGYLVDFGAPNELAEKLTAALSKTWDENKISRQVSEYGWNDVAAKVVQHMAGRIAN